MQEIACMRESDRNGAANGAAVVPAGRAAPFAPFFPP